MGCLGDLLETQSRKGLVVLNEFDAGLEFKELPAILLRDASGCRHELAGDAFASRLLRHCDLADVYAVASDRGERAPDQILSVGSFGCEYQSLVLRLGAKVVDSHSSQRGRLKVVITHSFEHNARIHVPVAAGVAGWRRAGATSGQAANK